MMSFTEARRAAACAEAWASVVQLPLAAAWADRAVAAVALHTEDPGRAAKRALNSAAAADEVGAPIEAALARALAGRALARADQRDPAVAELQRAAAALDACGALLYRDEAERELGKLGQRTHRRTRPGKVDVTGIDSLTERELEVARLVVDRKTNPEIAREPVPQQEDGRDTSAPHLSQDGSPRACPSRARSRPPSAPRARPSCGAAQGRHQQTPAYGTFGSSPEAEKRGASPNWDASNVSSGVSPLPRATPA
jgi:hypothetical protein